MLQAMNTGHEGLADDDPRQLAATSSRLETLVMTAGVELPHRAIREQISGAFDLLVQITRLVDGSRRVTHVTEVLRMESDVITLQDLFVASTERGAGRQPRLAPPHALAVHRPEAALPRKMAASGVSSCRRTSSSRGAAGPRPTFGSAGYGSGQ